MSVRRTIRTRLYAEDLPLILEVLEEKGFAYRRNSRVAGFERIFEIAVKVGGSYCLGFSRTCEGGETFFQIHADSEHLGEQRFARLKGELEAQVKALQIRGELARNGYLLTGFEENSERIVLRIRQAV
jgi:hypothetical protein